MSQSIKVALTALTLGFSLVACGPINFPTAIGAGLNTNALANSQSTASNQTATVATNQNSEQSQIAALLAGNQSTLYAEEAYAMNDNSYADYAGYASQSNAQPQEQDAWAGTCGPNADYNEQLVCSGVPASMLP